MLGCIGSRLAAAPDGNKAVMIPQNVFVCHMRSTISSCFSERVLLRAIKASQAASKMQRLPRSGMVVARGKLGSGGIVQVKDRD